MDGLFGYLATAAVSGTGGYVAATVRTRPVVAELSLRVEVAERGLYNQGQAIRELAEALRGLLTEVGHDAEAPSANTAVAQARRALARI